ncbi:MAG: hypothetical protein KIH08_05020 [Candidatus Freyarchaeota archaeon]|nr:hypothetical protein [Candidatus Jordarchaeia archaeon]MBS7268602.1 hypothetical protein [Candidatus Jordarchaeia archaeon]MBS7279291.1 hypothetical protein [Candidatus Jordarchaeia archaeon]
MFRRAKLFAILFTMVLLFLVVIVPSLYAPSVATLSSGEYDNSQTNTLSGFNQSQGVLSSNKIMLSLLTSDNGSFLPSGIFSFTQDQAKKIQFGVHYSQLIEFNDTNQNGMFDLTDTPINTTSLEEFNWSYHIMSNSGEVVLYQIGINLKFMPPLVIIFWQNLYLATKIVAISERYPEINFTVLGEVTVKTLVLISNYKWAPEDGYGNYSSRMLALNIALRSEAMPGNEKHLFQLANGSKIDSTNIMVDTSPVPSVLGKNECLITLVTLNNVTHGEMRWFNMAITESESLAPLNSSFMTNGTAFNLYLSVPHFNDTILLDPSFSMHNPPHDNVQEFIPSLFLVLYSYRPSAEPSHLIVIGVAASALITVIAYCLKRKRI